MRHNRSRARVKVTEEISKLSVIYNDICKGVPVITDNRRYSKQTSSERVELTAYVLTKREMLQQNPLYKRYIECQNDHLISKFFEDSKKILSQTPSKFVLPFEFLINALVHYSLMETLNYLSFDVDYQFRQELSEIVWAFFLIDFITNLFLLKRKTNKIFRSRKELALDYLKTWAVPDLVALIPLRWTGNPNAESFLKLTRVFKINRLKDMLDLRNVLRSCFQKIRKSEKRYITTEVVLNAMWELIILLCYMIIISFYLACLWWYWCRFIYRYNYSSIDFILFYNLNNESITSQIIETIYFITTSVLTIGYGDYTSVNTYEMGFCVLFLAVSILLFAAITSKSLLYLKVIEKSYKKNEVFLKFKKVLNVLHSIHGSLGMTQKTEILEHLLYFSETDRLGSLASQNTRTGNLKKLIKNNHFYFTSLPQHLKKSIINGLFKDYFPYFRLVFPDNYEIKYHLFPFLQPRSYKPGTIIIEKDAYSEEIYLFNKGETSLCFKDLDGSVVSCKIFSGKYLIGDYSAILNKPSFARFQAVSNVTGLALPKNPFELIMKNYYPDYLRSLKCAVKRRSTKLISLMSRCGMDNTEELLVKLYSVKNYHTTRNTALAEQVILKDLILYQQSFD